MPDTLLITGAAGTGMVAPKLAEKYDLCFLVPQAAQAAAEGGAKNVTALQQYADADMNERAHNVATMLSAKVVGGLPEIQRRFSEAYAPKDLRLGDWFAGYAHNRLGPMVMALSALERLVAQKKVVGCVVHEDVTLDTRVTVNFCKTRGIPTVHIPHAACHLKPGVQDIHRETRTDFIAASGQYMTEFYRESGFVGGVEETGLVQLDWMYARDYPKREEARRILVVDEKQLVLVYASTWPQTTSLRSRFAAELQETLNAVIALSKELGAFLAVKVHPHEGEGAEKQYVEALKQAGVKGLVTRHHNSYVTPAADVVIMHGPSNYALEAALLGVPSCYVQTEGFDFRHALPFRGPVTSLRDIVNTARNSRGDGRWQDFLRYYNAAHPDGGAVDRTAEYIERCLNTP